MDKVILGVLIFVILTVVFLLVMGVQKAKKNGEYLQPDFVEEEETVCPEEEDGA